MLLLYETMTGNVKRFLEKVGLHEHITEKPFVNEPFILVTNTIGFGESPESVKVFLRQNGRHLAGVAASGNRNWGKNFAHAADVIAAEFQVPILYKFELGGTAEDVTNFRERVKAFAEHRNKAEVPY
ncbi:class Ib ribonucleoside-diphosphate reductase assembly flavoprotein NrdI [Terrilactibacillus sp. S3-3]|nr:class Ib ribonucleoside-diphosphate reductase assembly flavoprotein NrdI [Terrilactibacillus sp. S3-3]